MNHVSYSLREVLAGCGIHDRTVGAGKVMVMVMDAGERLSAHPAIGHRQGGEVTGPMGKEPVVKRPAKFPKLVWTNTAMTKATGRRTSRAALAMIVK